MFDAVLVTKSGGVFLSVTERPLPVIKRAVIERQQWLSTDIMTNRLKFQSFGLTSGRTSPLVYEER